MNSKEVKVKICGLRTLTDVESVVRCRADLGGMVLFYPKSRRNVEICQAKKMVDALKKSDVHTVAVTVSPTAEQLLAIEETGFDFIQIHGELLENVYEQSCIPLIRALNMKDEQHAEQVQNMIADTLKKEKIEYLLLDAGTPGAGKTFSWQSLQHILRKFKGNMQKSKLIIAGGLRIDNVNRAIEIFQPDMVDVSSGVELEDGSGKSPKLIEAFVKQVRN